MCEGFIQSSLPKVKKKIEIFPFTNGERNGNPLQYSCLGNLMGRGAWWTTAHGVTKRWTQLSD